MIRVDSPEIVSIQVGGYTVQKEGATRGIWYTCQMASPEPGSWNTVPAVFNDVTEAEWKLNGFRDANPTSNYRMIRTVAIVEVVHA